MSTRYIWEKHKVVLPELDFSIPVSSAGYGKSNTFASSYYLTLQNGNIFVNAYPPSFTATTAGTYSVSQYPCIIMSGETVLTIGSDEFWGDTWVVSGSSASRLTIKCYKDGNQINFLQSKPVNISDCTPGESKGYISDSSRNKYKDGVDTQYSSYLVYKGSDSIDPTKLACSNPEPGAGETVTLTVTPRSNTYGGTIYYQYQYSTNGGNTWKNIGSRTTSTTQTVQIPDDAEQFQARVLASDDWGFTSSDYVYTDLLEVSNGHWYVGVDGIARKTKRAYIGISGTARRIRKAYIGVDGVAREFYRG